MPWKSGEEAAGWNADQHRVTVGLWQPKKGLGLKYENTNSSPFPHFEKHSSPCWHHASKPLLSLQPHSTCDTRKIINPKHLEFGLWNAQRIYKERTGFITKSGTAFIQTAALLSLPQHSSSVPKAVPGLLVLRTTKFISNPLQMS